jgi:hypothetical protein
MRLQLLNTQSPVLYGLELNLERKSLRIGAVFAVVICVQRSSAPEIYYPSKWHTAPSLKDISSPENG